MKKFRVMFWLENGNKYSYYVKAVNHENACSIAYDKMLTCENTDVNEICIYCVN